jgi:hypothetical protein
LRKSQAEDVEAFELTLDVLDGEGRERNPIGDECPA